MSDAPDCTVTSASPPEGATLTDISPDGISPRATVNTSLAPSSSIRVVVETTRVTLLSSSRALTSTVSDASPLEATVNVAVSSAVSASVAAWNRMTCGDA